jgi:hypothetical protein
MNGATVEEAEYLLERRVELNALTSEQFIALVERKLTEHGVKKIIPTKAVLAETYRTFARGRDVEKFFKRELRKLDNAKVTVPSDLPQQVEAYLRQRRPSAGTLPSLAVAPLDAADQWPTLCCGDVFSGAETTSV